MEFDVRDILAISTAWAALEVVSVQWWENDVKATIDYHYRRVVVHFHHRHTKESVVVVLQFGNVMSVVLCDDKHGVLARWRAASGRKPANIVAATIEPKLLKHRLQTRQEARWGNHGLEIRLGRQISSLPDNVDEIVTAPAL